MRYVLKQKLWSFGDDFLIRDASGETAFRVDGKVWSIGDKLEFQDASGRELALIRQKLLSWGPTYRIERGGRVVAEVRKHLFSFLRCRFTVDVEGPDDLEASGSFLDMEYTFRRGNRVVGEVSKRWFSWADTYGVDVAEGEDPVLILASTVVIDMVCHQESRKG
ncbi:MAG: LURP-one-related family protein [Verrucomicrobiales bacterium]|nr:LURP-one-related family protein [Verrucomicrobiales bacterium]